MIQIKPFSAIRPQSQFASTVACVPYDVVSTKEAQALATGNPNSFLRIIRSEIELDPETDPYSETVYQLARKNLISFVERGILINDKVPSLFIYRLTMGDICQTGIVGCSAVQDYTEGRIVIHEKTRPEKVQDRVRHILELRAHSEPTFLTFRDNDELKFLIKRETQSAPLYQFRAADEIEHTVWKAINNQEIVAAYGRLPKVYIADGHHRIESASVCAAKLRDLEGEDPQAQRNFFLSVSFPHSELQILPYNRIIKTITKSGSEILRALAEVFTISDGASPSPAAKGQFSLYIQGSWYGLTPIEKENSVDPYEALDVTKLYRKALRPIFEIGDERTDKNIEFVGGIRGTKELERLVDSGYAACAFSLYPVSTEELFTIADRGMTMAPKSTWFEPKLRSGLFIHPF